MSLFWRFQNVLKSSTRIQSNIYIWKFCLYTSSGFHSTPSKWDKNMTQQSRVQEKVDPYGTLKISKSFSDISIRPTNPDEFPNMDAVVCTFLASQQIPGENMKTQISLSSGDLIVDSENIHEPSSSLCVLELPIKYDVCAVDSNGENNVNISSMESASIDIFTSSGNITSKSIKSDVIKLRSKSGDIICQSVTQGNTDIQTESGNINGYRFQGPLLKMSTVSGSISTESVYSDVSHFSSNSGSLSLKNMHRQCHVTIRGNGNLTVSGMDGSLNAKLGSGSHIIQISQLHENSFIEIDHGKLVLKVPEQCEFGIQIQARNISVPDTMKNNVTDRTADYKSFDLKKASSMPVITINAQNGEVAVEFEDWLSSLGAKFKVISYK